MGAGVVNQQWVRVNLVNMDRDAVGEVFGRVDSAYVTLATRSCAVDQISITYDRRSRNGINRLELDPSAQALQSRLATVLKAEACSFFISKGLSWGNMSVI